MASDAETALRKEPTQQRSKERVERMLSAAIQLIGQHGSDSMKMGEVAERAGVSIGSLYQFFPDKSAIIRALAERHTAMGRSCIDGALAAVNTPAQLQVAFGDLIDAYYGIFRASPVTRDIWSGMQADKTLREIELADSRANARALIEAMQRAGSSLDTARLEAIGLLVWQLGEATMRLAVSVDRAEGDRMVEAYKRMALAEITAG